MKREWAMQGASLLTNIEKTAVDKSCLAFWYIGQCGYIYKGDVTIYIDPVLNDLTGPDGITRKNYQAPFEPEEVNADYILCTHGHADHLAMPTIKKIADANPDTRFIVPGGCHKILTEAGIEDARIIDAKAKERISLPGLEIFPVQAAHPVHEVDENGADLALCYQITMGEVTFLHMGDTYLTDQLMDDLEKLPSSDLFFAPINGGDYFRTRRDCIGNLSAIETATLASMLKPDLTVPMHFDMMQGNTVNPLHFVEMLWELIPAAKFHIPALGERFIYHK